MTPESTMTFTDWADEIAREFSHSDYSTKGILAALHKAKAWREKPAAPATTKPAGEAR